MDKTFTASSSLRLHADAISQTFSQCERACLHVGISLSEAIPGLRDLANLFASLSQSLESEAFRGAVGDLEVVAKDIEAVGRELKHESKALADLVDLNKQIGSLVESLARNLRIIGALVFNVKIEAALLQDTKADMIDFANALKQLSTRAIGVLEDYQDTNARLFELLQRSSDVQIKFEQDNQAKLFEISAGIAGSLGTIEKRRGEISKGLAKIGMKSQSIGEQIGKAITALQVGDSTRQRIEHAQQALYLAASIDDGSDFSVCDISSVDKTQRSAIITQICRLQTLQIDAALDEFLGDMEIVDGLLRNLQSDADGLTVQSRLLFGSEKEAGISFVDDLQKQLQLAHVMIEECCRARASVDNTTRAVEATIGDLHQRTAGLSEIVTDITMIGLNTVLKSNHLGQRGKCLTVIAQELQSYANAVVQDIDNLPPALQKVTDIVEQLADVGKAHDAGHLAALSKRMVSAIESFNASALHMSDALMRLNDETGAIGYTLNDALNRLNLGDDIRATLQAAVRSIDGFAASLVEQDLDSEIVDPIFQHLRRAYTMASEREIHDNFVGVDGYQETSDKNYGAAVLQDEGDLVDACLL